MQEFSGAGFTRADFATMTENSKLLFRKGAQNLIKMCQGKGIELIVVSGGIYELIDHSFRMLERLDSEQEPHDFSNV